MLLIACANIANLLLARFAGRRREIAARFALGAERRDVIRQLVTESMLVAGLGGVLGVVLAQWTVRSLVTFGADLIPRALEIAIDPLALGFALAVTLLTGLAIGVLPALQAARVNVQEALKDASRGSTGGGRRLRAGLLVAEVSLSLVLLIAAGLLVTSFARLQAVQPGFQPDGVFTAQLALPPQRYAGDALVAFYERFFARLAALPAGSSAALTDRVPLTGGQTPAPVAVVGRPLPPMSERAQANRHLVSPRYFATLGIPLRAGRDFDERDSARMPHVAIINATFAQRHFPGENPLGRTLVTGMGQREAQIVGVVADVRSTGLNTPPEADYFLPALQRPETFTNILVRSTLAPAAMAPLVREALRGVDPDLPLLAARRAQRPHRGYRRQPQAGVGAARQSRRPGARAGVHGRVQRHGASGGVPHQRDRHSHGARRLARGGDAAGPRPRPQADPDRHRAGHHRLAGGVAADAADAVRGRCRRPDHLRRSVSAPAAGRGKRVVVPGPAGDAHRSGDRAASRVSTAKGGRHGVAPQVR